jgi:hypothetical protein
MSVRQSVQSMVGDSPNSHIDEYLNYYVNFPHSPGFAVILNGAWGIGKTYLLKGFLENQRKLGKKCVYVSLYGLDALDEIDNALLRSIYPLLAMKGTRSLIPELPA